MSMKNFAKTVGETPNEIEELTKDILSFFKEGEEMDIGIQNVYDKYSNHNLHTLFVVGIICGVCMTFNSEASK